MAHRCGLARPVLERAGLLAQWQVKLPVRVSEKLSRLYVLGDAAYGLTDTNYLFCMDRPTGSIRFALSLARYAGFRLRKSAAISSSVTKRTPGCFSMCAISRSSIISTCGRPDTSGWMVIGTTA